MGTRAAGLETGRASLDEHAEGTLYATLLFHLNLDYSSIEVAARPAVVQACYGPLLDLLDELPWLVLALEAPGHTLELIDAIEPDWLDRLRIHAAAGRVEFVGSGDTQLIGPLVPASVNAWNQRLGQDLYEELLGFRPTTALVGEMAWSQGLVDAYLDAGYQRVCMEWNNPRRSHPEWQDEWRYLSARTASPSGREIDVLWADTIAFQKLQRAATGELSRAEYLTWLLAERGDEPRHLFLYANDAEIFDHRPGRYRSEPPLEQASEWKRLGQLLDSAHDQGVAFTTPAAMQAQPDVRTGPLLTLTSAADPVPVKKQPKYNVTRWALSGRDDIGLNAACFARARALVDDGGAPEAWRTLCRDWSSDRRTHLTADRWAACRDRRPSAPPVDLVRRTPRLDVEGPTATCVARRGRWLEAETGGVRCVLDMRRGLAIESLAFDACGPAPLVGTLRHGAFDEIDWAADFYSGHFVLEAPAAGRVTDLERVEPTVEELSDRIVVHADVPTALGSLSKCVSVFSDRVELVYGFAALGERPVGSLRAGVVTFLPESFGEDLFVTCASGGEPERMPLIGDFDHGAAVSSLVSARAAFGASEGRITIDDGRVALDISWPTDRVPALPLLTCRKVGSRRFVRLALSLGEIDETLRPGAPLRDLRVTVHGRRLT